jgi:hypothetical protein
MPPSEATNQYAGTDVDDAAAGDGATATTGIATAPNRQIKLVTAAPTSCREPLNRRKFMRVVPGGR